MRVLKHVTHNLPPGIVQPRQKSFHLILIVEICTMVKLKHILYSPMEKNAFRPDRLFSVPLIIHYLLVSVTSLVNLMQMTPRQGNSRRHSENSQSPPFLSCPVVQCALEQFRQLQWYEVKEMEGNKVNLYKLLSHTINRTCHGSFKRRGIINLESLFFPSNSQIRLSVAIIVLISLAPRDLQCKLWDG